MQKHVHDIDISNVQIVLFFFKFSINDKKKYIVTFHRVKSI